MDLLQFTNYKIDDGKGGVSSLLLCGLWGLFAYLGIYPNEQKTEWIARQLNAGGAVYLGGYKITKDFEK